MKIKKQFTISNQEREFQAIIYEEVNEGCHFTTWSSASLLAAYLVCHSEEVVRDKAVIEIGAGTALPSMISGLCGAKSLLITDRDNADPLYALIQTSAKANGIDSLCQLQALDWREGYILPSHPIDIILGADIFYNVEDFESLIKLLSQLLELHPHALCLIGYQDRSSHRTLFHLLERFRIIGEVVPNNTFLHPTHGLGFCLTFCEAKSECEESQYITEERNIDSFEDTYIIKLSKIRTK